MANPLNQLPGLAWKNLGNFALIMGWLASFALPAWAVKAAALFVSWGPLAWVIAGFTGMLVAATGYRIAASARASWVRTNYDAKLLAKGSPVDPMDRTFERKRIYLTEFALPSHPLIENKTFIDCEIIGPSNLFLQNGNNVSEARLPLCDAVLLDSNRDFRNGVILRNCTFRNCSFQRVTFFIAPAEYGMAKHVTWLNWITAEPPGEPQQLGFVEDADASTGSEVAKA